MKETDVLNKMADIELPAPPDWQPLIITTVIVLLLVLVATTIIRRVRSHVDNRLSSLSIKHRDKVLDTIREQWSAGRIDDREASYRLATLLRLGLGLPQLGTECPAALTNDADHWRKTIHRFNLLRYSKVPRKSLAQEDFDNVKQWIVHAPLARPQTC